MLRVSRRLLPAHRAAPRGRPATRFRRPLGPSAPCRQEAGRDRDSATPVPGPGAAVPASEAAPCGPSWLPLPWQPPQISREFAACREQGVLSGGGRVRLRHCVMCSCCLLPYYYFSASVLTGSRVNQACQGFRMSALKLWY